jgi:hypothetical protein
MFHCKFDIIPQPGRQFCSFSSRFAFGIVLVDDRKPSVSQIERQVLRQSAIGFIENTKYAWPTEAVCSISQFS